MADKRDFSDWLQTFTAGFVVGLHAGALTKGARRRPSRHERRKRAGKKPVLKNPAFKGRVSG